MAIGSLGVWAATEGMTADQAAAFAGRVEGWGYGALWIPEAIGRNALVHAAWLLARTTTLTVATGIANIFARDPMAAAAGQRTLAEQSGGRFLLGLGVSHAPLVGMRGHAYEQPLKKMRDYLEAMGQAQLISPAPPERPLTVIAALGPKMLALAAELADGVHPYNVTPAHTAQAREALGPDKLVCPEQMILLEPDPATARAVGRAVLSIYLSLPNYRNNLLRLGFAEADLDGGGSDRLIDGLIAWGDEDAIRARIQEHWDAGADHVCIQALAHEGGLGQAPDEAVLALLSPNG